MEKINGKKRKWKRSKQKRGLVIGKFMPPHLGHQYLIDFAKTYVDDLTVMVCTTKNEPINGEQRYKWVKEMFPNANVIHNDDENPADPKDHPRFWKIWKDSIESRITNDKQNNKHDRNVQKKNQSIDYLFASEDYGIRLAEVLNMKYIPVDKNRELVRISGTEVRKNPLENWDYLPSQVRPYYLKRICIFGPESTGKSTLAKKLAEHYKTVFCSEYARGFLEPKGGKCTYKDIPFIAKGQIASEEALAKQANRVLFTDTDVLTTKLWSEILFNKCPCWIKKEAKNRNYDLYLLLDTDIPFVPDSQRYLPNARQLSIETCKQELEKYGKKYVIINGNYDERFNKAIKEVEKVLQNQ